MKLWLSPEVLSWNRDVLDPRTSQGSDFQKPYELLKQAKRRLGEADDGENPDQENPALGEVVYHLRRAIEHREKQLAEKFNLSGLPFEVPSKKNPRIDERLYQLRIIQPVLRRKLNDLRNFITHEQKDPYGKDKSVINELYEFAWYFIRSTDSFLGRYISGIVLYPPDSSDVRHVDNDSEFDGCFLVRFSPKHKWEVDIEGYRVPINLFSKNEKEHWFQLVVNHFDDFIVGNELGRNVFDYSIAFPFEDGSDDSIDVGREKKFDKYSSSSESIKHFKGTLLGPDTVLRSMIEEYLELYMFY